MVGVGAGGKKKVGFQVGKRRKEEKKVVRSGKGIRLSKRGGKVSRPLFRSAHVNRRPEIKDVSETM